MTKRPVGRKNKRSIVVLPKLEKEELPEESKETKVEKSPENKTNI